MSAAAGAPLAPWQRRWLSPVQLPLVQLYLVSTFCRVLATRTVAVVMAMAVQSAFICPLLALIFQDASPIQHPDGIYGKILFSWSSGRIFLFNVGLWLVSMVVAAAVNEFLVRRRAVLVRRLRAQTDAQYERLVAIVAGPKKCASALRRTKTTAVGGAHPPSPPPPPPHRQTSHPPPRAGPLPRSPARSPARSPGRSPGRSLGRLASPARSGSGGGAGRRGVVWADHAAAAPGAGGGGKPSPLTRGATVGSPSIDAALSPPAALDRSKPLPIPPPRPPPLSTLPEGTTSSDLSDSSSDEESDKERRGCRAKTAREPAEQRPLLRLAGRERSFSLPAIMPSKPDYYGDDSLVLPASFRLTTASWILLRYVCVGVVAAATPVVPAWPIPNTVSTSYIAISVFLSGRFLPPAFEAFTPWLLWVGVQVTAVGVVLFTNSAVQRWSLRRAAGAGSAAAGEGGGGAAAAGKGGGGSAAAGGSASASFAAGGSANAGFAAAGSAAAGGSAAPSRLSQLLQSPSFRIFLSDEILMTAGIAVAMSTEIVAEHLGLTSYHTLWLEFCYLVLELFLFAGVQTAFLGTSKFVRWTLSPWVIFRRFLSSSLSFLSAWHWRDHVADAKGLALLALDRTVHQLPPGAVRRTITALMVENAVTRELVVAAGLTLVHGTVMAACTFAEARLSRAGPGVKFARYGQQVARLLALVAATIVGWSWAAFTSNCYTAWFAAAIGDDTSILRNMIALAIFCLLCMVICCVIATLLAFVDRFAEQRLLAKIEALAAEGERVEPWRARSPKPEDEEADACRRAARRGPDRRDSDDSLDAGSDAGSDDAARDSRRGSETALIAAVSAAAVGHVAIFDAPHIGADCGFGGAACGIGAAHADCGGHGHFHA